MTCEEKLGEILQTYTRVSMLSWKNGCRVLRIRHNKLKKDLCLHILPETVPAYELLAGLKAANLPPVYDAIPLSDGMLVLEEYIDGMTLDQICECETLSKARGKTIIADLCDACTVLHSHHIIHRDIKPENVVVDKNGRAVLIDFNVSRKVGVKKEDTQVMGTVGYASPEQLGIMQTDERTDIYALGILLNVLLTGKHPVEWMAKGRMGRIVKKCTAVSPNDRYQSAQKLKRALFPLG